MAMFTSLRNLLNPVFYSGGGSSAGAWSKKCQLNSREARGATQFNLDDSSSLDVCSCTYFVVASICAQYFFHEQQI